MKTRSGPNARLMTQMVSHYRHAQYQHPNATGTMLAMGAQRDGYARPNAIDASSPARKVKVLKSGVRRITYR
jgi:hypothetical protein